MWEFQVKVNPKGLNTKVLRRFLMVLILVGLLVPASLVGAAPTYSLSVPQVVSYQGQIAVGGQPFNGPGYFKFALVDQAGTSSYWSNDGSSNSGSEPAGAVTLTVNNGLFSVLLGDVTVANMTQPLTSDVFSSGGRYLRIWFSPDNQGFQQLAPDRLIASVPYALTAEKAASAANASQLNGQPDTYYLDASHINAGTLNNNRYDARGNLIAAGHLNNSEGSLAQNNGTLQNTLNADLLDGQHAASLSIPSGAIVLGMPGDPRMAGLKMVGISSVACMSCTGFGGNWGAELPVYSTPSPRFWNTAVWTGREIIVWGGSDGSPINTGARYDPITNIWTPISTVDAPSPRYAHSAVWTGTEMIIWGGKDAAGALNTGARYNPATDSWATMSTDGAPTARTDHRAVWTGREMIIWGGQGADFLGDGAMYNPSDNSWILIPADPAISARGQHTMEWTGSQMCVWGGASGGGDTYKNDGACYDPTKTVAPWTPIPTSGAPSARVDHTSVWTGHEMIIWGGENSAGDPENTGARYNPAAGTWTEIPMAGAPKARATHTAVWTGSGAVGTGEMIVWGGWSIDDLGNAIYRNDGARYNPTTGSWTALETSGAPSPRSGHMAVWTGGGSSGLGEMIIYGGIDDDSPLNTGGRYNLFLNLYQKP